MFIAHVSFQVSPADRAQALDTLLAEAPAVRAMPGCAAFVPFLHPTDPGQLGILHEWATEADFAAYLGSAGFARSGRTLRPLMVAAPVSRRFAATPVDTAA